MMNSVVSSLQNTAKWSVGYGVISRVAGRYASGMGNPYAVAASYFTSSISEKCFNKISSYVGPTSQSFALFAVKEVLNIAASTLIMQGVGQMIDPEFNSMTMAKIYFIGAYSFTAARLGGLAVIAVGSRLLASYPAKEEASKLVQEIESTQVKEPAPQPTQPGIVEEIAIFPETAFAFCLPVSIFRKLYVDTYWQEDCYFLSKAGGHMMDEARISCDYADSLLNSVKVDVFMFALWRAIFRIGGAAFERAEAAEAKRKSESDVAKNETSQKGSSQVATVS